MDKENWEFTISKSVDPKERIEALEKSVTKFNGNISRAMDRIAPFKVKNIKASEEPWKENKINKDKINDEREKWMEWKNDPSNEEQKSNWLKSQQILKRSYGEEKSKSIKRNISKSISNNGRSLWKGVEDTMNWKTGGPPGELRDKSGSIVSNPLKVAEIFHDKLEEKVTYIMLNLEEFSETVEEEMKDLGLLFGKSTDPVFEFKPIDKEQLLKIIKKLPRKSSHGDDGISYIDLLDGAYYTIDPLLQIINQVIETGHWPSKWKNSVIKPLSKGTEDKWDASGYRPVALTSTVSRVVEWVLNVQLTETSLAAPMDRSWPEGPWFV